MDNLRWVTVLLVLLYHVVYFYNNKGVFGGIGGFGDYPEVPQYQDVLMYLLYPWFMPLLFLLAGIGSRYALEKRPAGEWFRDRTRKLLVPSTIGLFVFHWMVGYFNTVVAARQGVFDNVPAVAKYFIMAVSGTGPLWFIQLLWLLCIVLLLVRLIDHKDRFWNLCGRAGLVVALLLGVLFWLAAQTMVQHPNPESADGLLNLYKPLFYLVLFLMGWFVFSHDELQEKLARFWIPLMACAVVSGIVLVVTTFGQDNTSPQYQGTSLNCLYGWLMCLAMMAWFKARFNRTNRFATYMTRSSYGLYIVHYLVVASLGYMMKLYTSLPPVAIYLLLAVAVFTLSPLLYELLHRIPFVRWCLFGEKRKKYKSNIKVIEYEYGTGN